MNNYILDGHTPVPCPDIVKWGLWYETADRHVARDIVNDVTVSTVFLGIDHSFGRDEPVLFETMIFGGPHDEYQRRYCTWDEAEAGHRKALALVAAPGN